MSAASSILCDVADPSSLPDRTRFDPSGRTATIAHPPLGLLPRTNDPSQKIRVTDASFHASLPNLLCFFDAICFSRMFHHTLLAYAEQEELEYL
jgi:hypothetical protein